MLRLLVALSSSVSVIAQGIAPAAFLQVAPASAAAAEGPTSTALPFGSTLARRVQFAYDGSTIGHGTPTRISSIALRCDGATAGAPAAGTYNLTLRLATSRNPVGALDPTFANNLGSDLSLAHRGVLSVPAPPVGSAPNAFGLAIPCNPPFEWDPRNGPLLLDITYNASTPAFGAWDAVTTGVAGLTANGATATVATASLTAAPVLELRAPGFVAPSANATTEAATGTSFPWGRTAGSAMRVLHLHDAAAMNLPGPQRITALAWRTDLGAAATARTFDVRITLSTSPRTSTTMTSVFADQVGADAVVVFDGVLHAPAGTASTDPGHFDLTCELQRWFEYDPARGSLAVDIRLRSCTGTSTSWDCTLSTAGVGRMTHTTDANAAVSSQTPQPGVAMPIALRTLPIVTAPASALHTLNPAPVNGTNFPFGNASCRSLQLVSATAAGVTQPFIVRHLRFRPSRATSGGPSTFAVTVDLSAAATTPATVSAAFEANHGADRRRVFDGMVSLPFFTPSAVDPGFLIEIKLDEPFLWDPANSPYLAIDLRSIARIGPAVAIETTSGQTVDDARVTAASANAFTGTTQTIAAALQLSGDHQNGVALNYGAGCTGTNGVPICTTIGVPCLPDRDFRIRVRQAAGSALAFLLVGFTNANVPLNGAPGCAVLNGLEIGTFGFAVTDPVGDASLALALGHDPAFEGFQFRTQWIVLDPSANALGLATSDGQVLTMKFF